MSASSVRSRVRLENITVTSASGKVYNLGNPNSRFFRARVLVYKVKRRREAKADKGE